MFEGNISSEVMYNGRGIIGFPASLLNIGVAAGGSDGNNKPPKKKFEYDYPRPAYTTDIVVFCLDKVLLIRRGKQPYQNMLALPGGFVNEGETGEQAAYRELKEETGLRGVHLYQLGIYDGPGRDPRGWTISQAFRARVRSFRARVRSELRVKGMDDAVSAEWWNVDNLSDSILAFDHYKIIKDALEEEMKFV